MEKYQLYINGEFRDSSDGKTYISYNPADGSEVAEIAKANVQDAKDAIKAARKSFDSGVWRNLSGEERSKIIKQIVDKINENKDRLMSLEIADSGATFKKAFDDVFLSAKNLNGFSKLALVDLNEISDISKEGVSQNLIRYEPIGVVGQIVPWNFPLKMIIWKIGPALAAGCSIVIKPATLTPVTALELARLIDQTDLPKGVINFITGSSDVGTELATNPDVDKIAFTGSTDVGKIIMQNASSTLKNLTLECGGKSANIVLDDADIDHAVDGAIYAAFYHQGQCCEGGTRLLVQDKIYDEFISKLKAKVERMNIGDPANKKTDVGPVISKEQFDTVMDYIKIAKDEGGEILTGGESFGDKGFFIKPTVIVNANNKMKHVREEIFGPVVSVIKFSTDDEAIEISNDSVFGLAGAVWSTNEERALNIANKLRTGTVWINEYHLLSERVPFGGYKQSGIGREFGLEGLKEYLEVKHIHIDKINDRSKKIYYGTVVPKDV